jgi:flagellar biosynthesis activator protein FlaF
MGIDAYRQTQTTAEMPRAEEYRQLAALTLAMTQAEEKGDVRAKLEAVFQNQKFWSSLRLMAASAQTSLPVPLKADFVSLADWVERESALASLGEVSLESLIAVNKQIMDGLKPFTGSLAADTLQAAPSAY